MSQASRILALLRTGPKTTREILAEVPSVVHSRIAQLREQGYEIACDRVKGYGAGAFRYTLLSEPEAERLGPDGSGSLSGVESKPEIRPTITEHGSRAKDAEAPASLPPDGADPFAGAHPAPAAQLSLIEAA